MNLKSLIHFQVTHEECLLNYFGFDPYLKNPLQQRSFSATNTLSFKAVILESFFGTFLFHMVLELV